MPPARYFIYPAQAQRSVGFKKQNHEYTIQQNTLKTRPFASRGPLPFLQNRPGTVWRRRQVPGNQGADGEGGGEKPMGECYF